MRAWWNPLEEGERPQEIPFGFQLLVLCAMVWALVSGACDLGMGG